MAKNDGVKVDWGAWFESPDAEPAKRTLASTKDVVVAGAASGIGGRTESELLGTLARRRKRRDGGDVEDLYAALEAASLEDLRAYVAEHATAAVGSAAAQWDRKRNAGWRRARTGFQRFAMTFDRFLAGFQGVVEIVKMADSQYGGAATQVLSILFAVGPPLQAHIPTEPPC